MTGVSMVQFIVGLLALAERTETNERAKWIPSTSTGTRVRHRQMLDARQRVQERCFSLPVSERANRPEKRRECEREKHARNPKGIAYRLSAVRLSRTCVEVELVKIQSFHQIAYGLGFETGDFRIAQGPRTTV